MRVLQPSVMAVALIAFGSFAPVFAGDNPKLEARRPIVAPVVLNDRNSSSNSATVRPSSPPGLPTTVGAGQNKNAPISLSDVRNATSSVAPSINCRVPVQKIGSIELYNSVAIIDGDTIEIRSATESPEHLMQPALKGIVLKSDAPNQNSDGMRAMTGLAYFTGGRMLLEFGNKVGEDTIFRREGSISGDVVLCDHDDVWMLQRDGRQIKTSRATITYLRSPRAFLFTLSGRQSARAGGSLQSRTTVEGISFQPTLTESSASAASPTSIVPHRDDYDEDAMPPGFSFTSSQSRVQPAVGNGPLFDNNMPPGPRRMMPGNWP